nr:RNA polymerase ECF-type sigma factor [uncultured bacterium]
MDQLSDKELVAKIQANKNDHKSFELLIIRHQEKLYSFIRRMLQNHEDTNDVLQNVFLKAWKYLNKFDGRSSFYTWIYRIAYNETIDQLNKNKKHFHQELSDVKLESELADTNSTIPTSEEISNKLFVAINTLPDKQKLVFNMKYFENKKYTEISHITGTSEGALKASYFHAVKKIEAFLKNDQTFL